MVGLYGQGKDSEYEDLLRELVAEKRFDEQKHYWDVLNKINNTRYDKPMFYKCKSCGFGVVDYQLDKNGICTDCKKYE